MTRRLALGTTIALASALTAPQPASAQAGTCGTGNAGRWCVHQDSPSVIGVAQPNDRFGAALALGDFDADGKLDLAVGAPGEADGIANNAGLVHVFYGAGLQLGTSGNQTFDQDYSVLDDDGGTESGDEFGAALAAADFDGDGFDDLAIGSPGENLPRPASNNCGIDHVCQNGGVVHVLFGSATGLGTLRAKFLDFNVFGGTTYEDGARFGSVLGAVDENDDDQPELMAGMPKSDTSADGVLWTFDWNGTNFVDPSELDAEGGGGADRFPSAATSGVLGLGPTGRKVAGCAECDLGATDAGLVRISNTADLVQTDFGTAGVAADDRFGTSLAVADFDGDGEPDLAAGAPFKNHGSGNPSDSGRVYVAFGPIEDGPQNEFDILGEDDVPSQTPAADEWFGSALAAGDFDGDGDDDLVVGAPGEFSGGDGALLSFFGTSGGGLLGSTRFNEGSLGGVSADGHAFGSVLAAGDLDGDGIDELVVGVPDAAVGGDDAAGIVYVTRVLDPAFLFVDGFEEDTTANWSDTVP